MTKKIANPQVAEVFAAYPEQLRRKLLFLRQTIFDTAAETEGVGVVGETLKWGQPSYLAKGGSTIRIDRRGPDTNQYAMYFHCQTKLIGAFRELYGELFRFEGNRAIVFDQNDEIPLAELKHCISLSLTYHKRKALPLLGA